MNIAILNKVYEPLEVENRWYQYWLDKNYFKADLDSSSKTFSIVIPPPNVTGSLHMGHALNNTLQDILVRYKRMAGFNVLWMPGTDHAGIATQNVVEKQLHREGKSRHDLGRTAFIKRVWKWREEFGGIITNQLKKLGASCDWSRERFTMDEGLSEAVREVFVKLYQEGLIYRGDYIINWCPRCHTALSDLEVEYKEMEGYLWHIKYPIVNSNLFISIATTRPETMLGDTALAVNPKDDRYKNFSGKIAILPIIERKIPIITDSYVDQNFGTGALKITPAHDPNDFEIGLRHNLDTIKIMDEAGKMNENAGIYQGMDRFECREKLLNDLSEKKLIQKKEKYLHSIGCCYRCKTFIEPTLSKQWFIKVKPLANKAIEVVKQGQIRIIPQNWEKTYYEWMNNIKDWCISRQIWWGHRIPAWYCEDCKGITVAKEEPSSCSNCQGKKIFQEDDVLDTWFSSALWPFSTMGWPNKTRELELFYPTSILVTGFDILFFWVARMIMLGLKFMDSAPFEKVYIHALVRDAEGQKMSKSKGNAIDPLIIFNKYGTDAFRFTLAALAAPGRDIRLSEERIEGYRNFVNKIWNASRFILMNSNEHVPKERVFDSSEYSLADRWILSRLHNITGKTRKSLDEYRFDEAANLIYQFVWHEFCDWYIELTKIHLYNKQSEREKEAAQHVLTKVLDVILRLVHPFMPFVSEEIWQKLPDRTNSSIMVSPYPEREEIFIDEGAEKQMKLVIEVVGGIRNLRGEMNIPPSQNVEIILLSEVEETRARLNNNRIYIENLAGLSKLSIHRGMVKRESIVATIVDQVEILLPAGGVIDLRKERGRLEKEIKKIDKDLTFIKTKLSNKAFLEKAPQDIVTKEKTKEKGLMEKKKKLQKNLNKLTDIEDS